MRFVILALCFIVPAAAHAQGSTYVPLDDSAYRLLDRLSAAGWIAPTASLSRPLSRAAIRRLLDDANPDSGNPALSAVLEELRREFDSTERLIQKVSLSAAVADHDTYAYRDNNLGGLEADVAPLFGLRQGREYSSGAQIAAESEHALARGPFALFAQPRASAGDQSHVLFQQLYARAVFHRITLDAGRADRVWNPGHTSGVIIAGNARAPFGLRVATDGPLTLPGLLALLGPVQAELLWADLGDDRSHYPGANLLGWRVGLQPWRALQLGAQLLSHYGGSGSPAYSTGDVIKDLIIPFADDPDAVQFSDKLAGIDFRIRVPGATAHGEFIITDVDTNPDRFRKWLVEEGAHIYGIELDRLTTGGDLIAYAEFHHTGHRFYRHHQFESGYSYQREILGNPLGPDADAVYVGVLKDLAPRSTVQLQAAWERRSADTYRSTPLGVPGPEGYIVEDDYPEETRLRLTAAWRHEAPLDDRGWSVRAGIERASNFAQTADLTRTNVLLEAMFFIRF